MTQDLKLYRNRSGNVAALLFLLPDVYFFIEVFLLSIWKRIDVF